MLKSFYRGRTGNLLFQHTFARLLAEELGYACELPPVPGFEQLPTSLPGTFHGDFNMSKPASDDYVDKNIRDIADELKGYPVMCYGFYERASLYTPYRRLITEWFKLPRGDREPRSVIHIRGHEAAREGYRCPPISYFHQAIEQSKFPERCIVTDDPDNDVCLTLARHFCISVYCRDVMEDWEYIRNSAQIILGNSTFSWWAAFLSGHNNVIQPQPMKGWRSRENPQKCLLVDEWKHITY